MKVISQIEAASLFERYAMLNGVKEVPYVKTQRSGRDFYEIPGMRFIPNSWLVYDLGDRKTEIAMSMISQSVENGWNGQPESEMKSLLEFLGKPPALAIRWNDFLSAMAI